MKAVITIPLKKNEADNALNAIKQEQQTERSETNYKTSKEGLEIEINSKDTNALRAAINTVLKQYKIHEDVKTCLKCQKNQEIK